MWSVAKDIFGYINEGLKHYYTTDDYQRCLSLGVDEIEVELDISDIKDDYIKGFRLHLKTYKKHYDYMVLKVTTRFFNHYTASDISEMNRCHNIRYIEVVEDNLAFKYLYMGTQYSIEKTRFNLDFSKTDLEIDFAKPVFMECYLRGSDELKTYFDYLSGYGPNSLSLCLDFSCINSSCFKYDGGEFRERVRKVLSSDKYSKLTVVICDTYSQSERLCESIKYWDELFEEVGFYNLNKRNSVVLKTDYFKLNYVVNYRYNVQMFRILDEFQEKLEGRVFTKLPD